MVRNIPYKFRQKTSKDINKILEKLSFCTTIFVIIVLSSRLNISLELLGLISLILFSLLAGIGQSSSGYTIYSVHDKPFGIPYQDWVARWWNWTFGIPVNLHPRDDPNNSCSVKQNGPVWFLPDPLNIETKSNPRVCEIPLGKAIFVPLVTGEVSTLEKPGYTDAQLVKEALVCDNYSKVRQAQIDGTAVSHLDDMITYRTNSSKVFNTTIIGDNIYNIKPGTGRAFADGWFLFIGGLGQGEHRLHLVGSIDSPDQNCNSSGDVNWVIRVK